MSGLNLVKIDRENLIVVVIAIINISATIYTNFHPKNEDELFKLYFGSVAGLWGASAMQSNKTSKDDDSKP